MKIINPLLYQQVYNTATSLQQRAIEDIEDIEIINYEEDDDLNENNESSSL